ncbi:hypothetical protein PspLS_06724 [Pyricularia sp. CBS 133598]|nr:hypothetical protein PspLS_06724 [Pyricularia sp. CBS 133598]
MTEPSRRFSSEAASNTKSPVGSLRKSTPPLRSPHHPDTRRLSSNSQDQPATTLDQGSISTQQRQVRSGGLQHPSQESLLLQQQQAQQHQPTPPPPPVFTPVFALVDDATGRPTTHHPRVHYIFSDDDPEELTAALDDAAAHHPHPPTSSGGAAVAVSGSSRDRTIVVDLVPSPDGRSGSFSVVSAVSLSPEWAVTSVQVSRVGGKDADVPGGGVGNKGKARDGADASDDKDVISSGDGDDNGLMLRIEGVGVDPAAAVDSTLTLSGSSSGGSRHSERRRQKQQQGPGPNGEEEFAVLADDFDRRMSTLRRVVDASIPGLDLEEQRAAHAAVGDETASPGAAAAEAVSFDQKATP